MKFVDGLVVNEANVLHKLPTYGQFGTEYAS